MKLRLFLIVSFLLVSVTLFGAETSLSEHHNWTSYRGSGGPDAYGYTWIDSDEAGGPTYNWIDITTIGTEVMGLADDNNVGPLPIGFDFPYYWYKANSFYVESNGAISFSDAGVYFPQESSFIPSTVVPNDLVIPLGADLSLEAVGGGKCYYYSNNTDTLIISFVDVPAWTIPGLTGSHSFQVILTAADSCIFFEFGKQEGTFYQSTCCTGIEDVIGDVGLMVFYHVIPDSGLAVQFIPPLTTSYEALDVGVQDAISEGSEGVFYFPGDPYTLWTTIRNYGNMDASSFDVTIAVRDTSGTMIFADTSTINSLLAGTETTVNFTPQWTPAQVNDYIVLVQTHLTGDINPNNNSVPVEIEVINIPGWLMYDSDPTSGSATYWYGSGSGWGQEFEPPQYPTTIDSVLVTMASTNSCNVPILFMDDDGSNGGPGTILYADTIFVPAGSGFNYYSVGIPSAVNTITEGTFYVGMIQVGDSFPQMIMENSGPSPYSRRSWEFTGSWAPYRSRDINELLIRAHTSSTQGITEDKKTNKSYALALLPTHPNPVREHASINYALPNDGDVSLKIYNLLGQEVRTLVNNHQKSGIHSVTFDGLNSQGNALPQGIYFYRLAAGNRTLTRKLTLLR